MGDRPAGPGAVRRRLRVLRHRNLRRYFGADAASKLGTAMASLALVFAVLDQGGSATDLGVVLSAGIVPQVLLMVGGGVVADRVGRRRVMLGADLLRTAAQASLAGLLLAGPVPIWAFCLTAAAVGTGDAVFGPAFSGLTTELAPADELGDANALFGASRSAAAVAGPALAGLLVAAAGPATVVALDAASYGISAVALAGLRLPPATAPAASRLVRDLAEGWGEFRSRTWLWVTTVQFTLFNLLAWGPFLLLGPVVARAHLGGAAAWGAIMAGFGAGAVTGGLAALGRRPSRPVLVATIASLGYPVPLALLALRAPVAVIVAGAAVAGLGSAGFNTYWSASLQQQVPAAAQSRVVAFALVGAYSAGPISFAAAGPVAAAIGAPLLLGVGAAWSAAASLVVVAVPAVRAVRWQGSAPPDDGGPARVRDAAAAGDPPG